MAADIKTQARASFRTALFVHLGQIASLAVYFLIRHVIINNPANTFQFISERAKILPLIVIFYALSSLPLFFMKKLEEMILHKGGPEPEKLVQKLVSYTVIRSAACEAPAVFGFVIFYITGGAQDMVILNCLSLFLLAINFPRFEQWKAYLDKHHVFI
jgi:hypothetical protein